MTTEAGLGLGGLYASDLCASGFVVQMAEHAMMPLGCT